MIVFLPVALFLFGLLIGSFLNVVILRMNTGRSVAKGRSMCMSCAKPLAWYELIPVCSFMGLRGKCRRCKNSISVQYPLVELLTGICFVVVYTIVIAHRGLTLGALVVALYLMVVVSLCMVMLVYDLRHKIIPDSIVYPFILLSLVAVLWQTYTVPGFSFLLGLSGGVLVALPFFALWFFSKGRLMGFGDVKLALGIGWLLGPSVAAAALLLSFWIGGIVGVYLLAMTRRYSMRSEIPFAPFLIVGMAIAGLGGITIGTLIPLWQ